MYFAPVFGFQRQVRIIIICIHGLCTMYLGYIDIALYCTSVLYCVVVVHVENVPVLHIVSTED